jgi:hypothetical protein
VARPGRCEVGNRDLPWDLHVRVTWGFASYRYCYGPPGTTAGRARPEPPRSPGTRASRMRSPQGAGLRNLAASTLPGHLAMRFIRRDHHVPALPSDGRDAHPAGRRPGGHVRARAHALRSEGLAWLASMPAYDAVAAVRLDRGAGLWGLRTWVRRLSCGFVGGCGWWAHRLVVMIWSLMYTLTRRAVDLMVLPRGGCRQGRRATGLAP